MDRLAEEAILARIDVCHQLRRPSPDSPGSTDWRVKASPTPWGSARHGRLTPPPRSVQAAAYPPSPSRPQAPRGGDRTRSSGRRRVRERGVTPADESTDMSEIATGQARVGSDARLHQSSEVLARGTLAARESMPAIQAFMSYDLRNADPTPDRWWPDDRARDPEAIRLVPEGTRLAGPAHSSGVPCGGEILDPVGGPDRGWRRPAAGAGAALPTRLARRHRADADRHHSGAWGHLWAIENGIEYDLVLIASALAAALVGPGAYLAGRGIRHRAAGSGDVADRPGPRDRWYCGRPGYPCSVSRSDGQQDTRTAA